MATTNTDVAVVGMRKALLVASESVGDDSDYAETARNWIRNRDDLLAAAILAALESSPPVPEGLSEDVERDIRIAIWNAAMNGGMGQDLSQAFIRRAMDEPGMKRALERIAASPAPHVGGWRDISSAPKDASILIAGGTFQDDNCMGGPYPFRSVAIAEWCDSIGEDHPWQGEAVHSHDEYRRHAPTHWMPLPTSPVGDGQ